VTLPSSVRLRILLAGEGQDVQAWKSLVARGRIEVQRVSSPKDGPSPGDLAMAVGTEDDVLEETLLEALSGARGPAVIVSPPAPGLPHPFFAWVEAILRAKADWEESFDAIVDPVVVLSSGGTIRRANAAFAAAVRSRLQDLPEALLEDVTGIPDPAFRGALDQAFAGMRPPVLETRFDRLEGLFQVTFSPVSGNHGVIVVLRDVTALREQEARIERAYRLADVGRLAGGVAHEISTPLASISLRAESLARKATDEKLMAMESFAEFPRYLKSIVDEAFRCKRIIGTLQEFSREQPPEIVPTDLGVLAESAAALVADQMRAKQVRFSTRIDKDLPRVPVDVAKIREALVALLLNAVDAASSGGQVEVAASLQPDEVVTLTVRDDGTGIPAENLDKIFTPFFTTKPVGRGTGMGLAFSDGIVRAHGGEIQVKTALGQGTEITIRLPLERKGPAPRTE
jgi:signal transduction histidine kinase